MDSQNILAILNGIINTIFNYGKWSQQLRSGKQWENATNLGNLTFHSWWLQLPVICQCSIAGRAKQIRCAHLTKLVTKLWCYAMPTLTSQRMEFHQNTRIIIISWLAMNITVCINAKAEMRIYVLGRHRRLEITRCCGNSVRCFVKVKWNSILRLYASHAIKTRLFHFRNLHLIYSTWTFGQYRCQPSGHQAIRGIEQIMTMQFLHETFIRNARVLLGTRNVCHRRGNVIQSDFFPFFTGDTWTANVHRISRCSIGGYSNLI